MPTLASETRAALGAALLILAFARSAAADPAEDRVRASERFSEAQALFTKRDYLGAAGRFEAAARLVPFATTWLNAAEARELGGDLPRAAEDCDRSLLESSSTTQTKTEARERLARLSSRIATLQISSASGTLVRVDGEETPIAPPATRRLSPGAHVLSRVATDRGPEPSVRVSLVAGKTETFDADRAFATATVGPPPPPPPPPPGAPPRPPGHPIPTATVVAWGGAGALAVATGIFGGLTLGAKSDYDKDPTRDNLDAFHRDRFLTNVGLGWTLAAAAAGAVLWWLAPAHKSSGSP